VGERSKEPRNRRYDMTQYVNKVQIFREVNEITDVQNASTVEVTDRNGSHYVIDRERAIKELAFKVQINGAFIGGRMSVTSHSDASPVLIDPTNGGSVQTTRGLDQWITDYGVNDSTAVADTWTFTDGEDTIGRLIAARAGSNYMVIGGTFAMLKVSNYLNGITTGISAGQLTLNGKTYDYGIQKLTHGGFTLNFKTMRFFDHPDVFSQTSIAKSLYYIPMDSVQIFQAGRGAGSLPRISAVWQDHCVQNDLGTEMIAEWDTGANARGGPTDSEMVNKMHLVTHQGLQILGAQHFAKVQVLT
jgi:hypothetical protein